MSVLLGIGEKNLSKSFKEILVKQGFDEVEEVFHFDYLSEKVSYEQPNIVILHEQLTSNSLNKEDKEKEILALVEHWRMAYNDSIRVVFICIRDRHDPFLAQLIAHNVLDIFPDKRVPVRELLTQLSAPPNFANVKRMASNLKVELLDSAPIDKASSNGTESDVVVEGEGVEEEITNATLPQVAEEDPSADVKSDKLSVTEKPEASPKGEKVTKTKSMLKSMADKLPKAAEGTGEEKTELFFDELLDLLKPDDVLLEDTNTAVIGTVLIGVAGVKAHLGSTHTALATARYLSKAGHSVVVVECNNSKDFDHIHTLYEGSKEMLKNDTHFTIDGIDHYKYRSNFDLNRLYSMYEYVVMDYGDLQAATHYFEEFKRAHIRLVVCSGDDWKSHWIDQFLKVNQLNQEDYTFVIPNATKDKAKEFAQHLHLQEVYAFPSQDDPYELTNEAAQVIQDYLGIYLHDKSFIKQVKTMKQSTVIIACLASVIVTAIIFTIFILL